MRQYAIFVQVCDGIVFVNVPSSTTDLGEGEENSPHLTLVAETILSDGLQLGVTRDNCQSIDFDMNGARSRSVARNYIQTSGLEWTSWDLIGLGVGTSRGEY